MVPQNEMILFTKDKMSKVFESLNITTEERNERTLVINPLKKEVAICECCGKEIHTENLGHIAHGSMNFYCKTPACFAHFVAQKKLW